MRAFRRNEPMEMANLNFSFLVVKLDSCRLANQLSALNAWDTGAHRQ